MTPRRRIALLSLPLAFLATRFGLADDASQELAKRVQTAVEHRIDQSEARLRQEIFDLLDQELAALHPIVQAPYAGADAAMESMTAGEAYRHVAYLASDELEGRDAGEPGSWKAAEYVRDTFRACGLKPIDPGADYFQEFSLPSRTLGDKPTLAVTDAAGKRTEFGMDRLDFMPFGFTGAGKVEAPLVFVGYGITAPEYQYDDYAGIDVKGKIVLCFRHEPRENDPKSAFRGKENTQHAWFTAKVKRAKELGAVGFLLVTDPNNHKGHLPISVASLTPGKISPKMRKAIDALSDDALRAEELSRADLEQLIVEHGHTGEESAGIPAAHVSLETADTLLAWSDGEAPGLEEVQKRIDKAQQPASFEVKGVRVALSVDAVHDDKKTCNVAGFLEGGDPDLRDECVVIGAHFDHLGRNAQGEVWNGADDNASGTAAVMQVARAIAGTKKRPARSILFLAFGAEEKGLIGSIYYVEHPLIPLDHTVAMLNMDMVGRGDKDLEEMLVLGRDTSPDLSRILDETNREIGFHLKNDMDVFENSDHYSFYTKNVPVLFFNSGLHKDYHQPSDEVQKIHPGKIRRCAQLVYRLAYRIAGEPERPRFTKLPETKGGNRPRLGVVPRQIDDAQRQAIGLTEEWTGLELTEVMPDFPAAKAGLKAGDIVVEIAGEGIPADDPMGALIGRLTAHPAGTPIKVRLWRKGEWLELEVPMP